jgi:hypothetical protein
MAAAWSLDDIAWDEAEARGTQRRARARVGGALTHFLFALARRSPRTSDVFTSGF